MANDRLQLDGVLSEGYGIIPRKVMKVKGISLGAKGLYSYFCSCAGQYRECFPSRETICEDLDISRDSFSKYLGELKKKKYLIVEQVKENGRFLHNVYHLPFNDSSCPKISDAEKTVSEITVSENSVPTNNNTILTNNNTPYNPPTASPPGDYSPIDKSTGDTPTQKEPVLSLSQRGDAKKMQKHRYGQYNNVLLTDEEYSKLQEEFPDDYIDRIERLSEYIASKGNSYKNHLATIRSWARRNREKTTTGYHSGGKSGTGNTDSGVNLPHEVALPF